MEKLLVIDNYDSFTYNLVQMFMNYDLKIDVFRSDMIDISGVEEYDPDYILISPGPKDPASAGVSVRIIESFKIKHDLSVPILGVCLGMQCINEAFNGCTLCSSLPMHGKTSLIEHNGEGIFRSMPHKFSAARYHSLIVKPGSEDLVVTAMSDDGVIMGLSHSALPIHGVQFHPESFLTEHGFQLIENFLNMGSLKGAIQNGQG